MKDVLDDILDTLGLQGALYFCTDFNPPWAVTVPELERAARFHLVIQGHCHVRFPSGQAVNLGPGDLILIPAGKSHVLADSADRTPAPLERVMQEAGYDGRGVFAVGPGDSASATQMICGHFTFRTGADHLILRNLPEFLVTTAAMRAREPWLDELLRLVAHRMFAGEFGSVATVTRLSEIVFIELLRVAADHNPGLRSMLETFGDRQIGRALELIHHNPEHPWTVASLAREVAMSRSRFADRFSELLGMGPMAYLADWRLQKALSLLDDSRCSVQQVAHRTGYRSPAAFTRAFAHKFGIPPSEYRRNLD